MSNLKPTTMQRTVLTLLFLLFITIGAGSTWAEPPARHRFATPLEIVRMTAICSLYGLSVEMQGDKYPEIAAWPPPEIYEYAWDLEYIPYAMDPSADFPDFVDVRTTQSLHRERMLEHWYAHQEVRNRIDGGREIPPSGLARLWGTAQPLDWQGMAMAGFKSASPGSKDLARWLNQFSDDQFATSTQDKSHWLTESRQTDNREQRFYPEHTTAPQQQDVTPSQWVCPTGDWNADSHQWVTSGLGKSGDGRW